MSEHFPGRKLRYYLTIPGPCPYLPGQEERKVFVHLPPLEAISVNDQLSAIGFRRSQNIAYRPACQTCHACQSVRIPVKRYELSKSDRRVVKANADLAKDLRLLVRERLKDGDTDQEVLDYLVSRYGEFVLLKPRLSEHTILLWGMPVFLALVAGSILLFQLRKRPRTASVEALSEDEQRKLDAILKK